MRMTLVYCCLTGLCACFYVVDKRPVFEKEIQAIIRKEEAELLFEGVSKKNEMYKRLKLCGAELFQSEVIKSTCPNGFVLDKHDILVDKSSAMSKQFQSCCQTGCSIARINYLFCK
ncbi:hypothetical protein QR680_008372 [Steinernema hermaphroditum]|uniref:Insulin-like domain-containing protein n=1 Tax=Steinernema hermaphroditum TaxID=289476 RepID=A0AA39IGD1_9BILA|nr:hypothetical protein QR680_008372 [Steinernema hermaphroditum]